MTATETKTSESSPPRETGAEIHRRETRRQILLPFLSGISLVIIAFWVIALPSQPIWRVRVEALSSWMISIMCLLPMLLCLMPVYLLVILGIYGMNRLHSSAERPLRRLENAVNDAAKQVERVSGYIDGRTVSFTAALAPYTKLMGAFDPPTTDEKTDTEPDNNPKPATDNNKGASDNDTTTGQPTDPN